MGTHFGLREFAESLCRDGRDGDDVWDWSRVPSWVSDKMFTLGVPSVFQLTSHVFRGRHYHLLLKIIKGIVISFLITRLLSFSAPASLALCFELTYSGSGCLWVPGVK